MTRHEYPILSIKLTFSLSLCNYFNLVSEKIEKEAFGRMYSNTLAVSGDKNYQTSEHMSGNKANTGKYFIVAKTTFIIS